MRTILVALTGLIVIHGGALAATVSGQIYVELVPGYNPHHRQDIDWYLSPQAWTLVYLDTFCIETDSTGAFTFENVAEGKHVLRCEVFGTKGASAMIEVGTSDINGSNLVVLPDFTFGHPGWPSDRCYVFKHVGWELVPDLHVKPLPVFFTPIDHEPDWGSYGPATFSGGDLARRCGFTTQEEVCAFDELLDPVCWCEARDTLWLISSSNNTLHGGCECGGDHLWLRASADGGRHWGPPLLLGLKDSIGFSPRHPWRIAVWGDWLYLDRSGFDGDSTGGRSRIRLSILRSDRDGDGITDLAEPFYGLNPDSADTDGDGLRDKEDPNPLVDEARVDQISEITAGFVSRLFDKLPGSDEYTSCPGAPFRQLLADTSDIVARPTAVVVFPDNCQRAVPVESGWVLCLDPRYWVSFEQRIGCSRWDPVFIYSVDSSGTQAVVGTGCEKSWSRHRIALCGHRWRYAGCIGHGSH